MSILGLYAGAFSVVWFSQASEINFFITKTVNESSFVILNGDFNKNSSYRSASFKRCLDLNLVNFLAGSTILKKPTWKNSKGIMKIIDYVLVSLNLANMIVYCDIFGVNEHFDTDHQAVSVSIDLGGLLNTNLNSLCKQGAISANAVMFSSEFAASMVSLDLDAMWDVVYKIMSLLANGTFKKNGLRFNDASTLVVKSLFFPGFNFNIICSVLAKVRKSYHPSKLLEFKCTEESHMKAAVNKRIDSFKSDKGHIIRSVLEHSFRKVVLDYLVVEDELVLEPSLVKFEVDRIMEGWTRKHRMVSDYVFNDVFLNIMCSVAFDKLLGMVSNLPEDKAAVSLEYVFGAFEFLFDLVLINTQSITLLETIHKILSKILSNRILLACNTYDVLHGDNFLILRDITMQSPIFAIGLVIENALKKNCELWLVL
ncbi:hypothetical protein G9A89_005749 [Geosiphon pyriformis]|nr:hypothetical protein G9A89_005749 [Geosiphon pyriformis]